MESWLRELVSKEIRDLVKREVLEEFLDQCDDEFEVEREKMIDAQTELESRGYTPMEVDRATKEQYEKVVKLAGFYVNLHERILGDPPDDMFFEEEEA